LELLSVIEEENEKKIKRIPMEEHGRIFSLQAYLRPYDECFGHKFIVHSYRAS